MVVIVVVKYFWILVFWNFVGVDDGFKEVDINGFVNGVVEFYGGSKVVGE